MNAAAAATAEVNLISRFLDDVEMVGLPTNQISVSS